MKWVMISCVSWLLLCAVALSNAGTDALTLIGVYVIAAVWMLVWLFRCLRAFHHKQQPDAPRLVRGFWLMEPLFVVAGLAAAHLGQFAALRFAVSESALARYATQVRNNQIDTSEGPHAPLRVGLYVVTMTDQLPDGTVRMITASHGLLDRAGFAHALSVAPAKRGEDTYTHLRGHWWVWRESW